MIASFGMVLLARNVDCRKWVYELEYRCHIGTGTHLLPKNSGLRKVNVSFIPLAWFEIIKRNPPNCRVFVRQGITGTPVSLVVLLFLTEGGRGPADGRERST